MTETNKLLDKANSTVNQNRKDKGVEYQGKLAVPNQKVVVRGQVKYTDDKGRLVKELANEREKQEERPVPDYIKFHEQVLAGKDPLELQRGVKPAAKVKETQPKAAVEENEDVK